LATVSTPPESSLPASARVFEDPLRPGEWRVEFMDEGRTVVTIFSGPNARASALQYAAIPEGNSGDPLEP